MTERADKVMQSRHLVVSVIAIVVASVGLFTFFQSTGTFADPDSFYHATMALLMREGGLVRDFPWAQFTVLAENFADQHLLYHVLLTPFVSLFDPLIGTKVATVMLATLLLLVFYFALRSFQARWPLVFTLLLLTINPLTFRLTLAKASALSIMLLLIGLSLAAHYRWRWLAVVSFLYVWFYGGFALLFVAVTTYVVISWLINRFRQRQSSHRFLTKVYSVLGTAYTQRKKRRLNIRVWLSMALGLLAGIVINPYWPKNLVVYLHQLVNIGIINFRETIGVGSEWYPYPFVELLTNTVVVTVLIIITLVFFVVFLKRQSKISITAALLWAFFLVLTLKSRRYVEYYVPFAMFFSAVSLSDSLRQWSGPRLKAAALKLWRSSLAVRVLAVLLGLMVATGAPYVVGRDIASEYRDHKNGFALDVYGPASRWLAANSPARSIVLHDDWDEFPVLFYHNHHNYYIVGLDPTFMYLYNEKKYWQWVEITTGRFTGDVEQTITDSFNASYVFVSKDHEAMNNLIKDKTNFPVVYEDSDARIYRVTRL